MTNFNLNDMGVVELHANEMIEIEGGKKFWDTIGGKLVMAVLVGFAGALGARLANEI